MAKIVGVGACVFDTLYSLTTYPKEDTKSCAISTKSCGGGPTATGLCAAAKLGVSASYIGNLSTDEGGVFLKKDFESRGVNTNGISMIPDTSSFRSVLWLCKDKGSRTCVFDRGTVPMLHLNEDQKEEIRNAEILMVDGNVLDGAVEAAQLIRKVGGKVLYDCGGLYPGVERLLALTDIMIPSEEFALGITKTDNVRDAAKLLLEQYSPEVVVITRGKLGGILYDGEKYVEYPIYPAEVLDSNGSGDVFHGAFAAGCVLGYDYEKCCHFSSAVSAIKCMGIGARDSVPDFDTVKKYMKENGYEL